MFQKEKFCYMNGKFLSLADARVSPVDVGILRGYGIYEGITTYNNKPFRLKDHLDRFRISAENLRLSVPENDETIESIIAELVKRNGFVRTNIRMILTGGEAVDGIDFDPTKPTFYILAEEYKSLPETLYKDGASLIVHEHKRFMPESKTINYITAVFLQKIRKEKGAIEVLYVADGKVLECATSNIFIFKDNTLVTPKKDVLMGITRKVVLELAKGKFEIEERDVSQSEFQGADEVFLSASYKEIVPIVSIDGRRVGDGKVGKNTMEIMRLFHDYTQSV